METSPNSQSLFNYYNAYKIILGILLYSLVLSGHSYLREFRFLNYFEALTLSYLILNILILILYRAYLTATPRQIFSLLILDILFLHIIFFCGTGIAAGLGNLIIITIAAGNIIIRGRIGLSFAALATLLSMLIEFERLLAGLSTENNMAQSGLIGAMYFASALILQSLSRRISQSEILVKKQKKDLLELEKLNHQIIQSMRTGIIVCSAEHDIKLLNSACEDLLNLHENQALPNALEEKLQEWQNHPQKRTTPFRVSSGFPMVQANFSRLQKSADSDLLIFIEDTRRMTQQAQQLKLASLGRLTASIAHEVRNPLGAISHATQLLAESDHLDAADKKMTDIIQRHSTRVNQIIEHTMQLSRRSAPEIQTMQLFPWLVKLITDYEYLQNKTSNAPHSENVRIICKNEAITARFDPNQMEQVVVNLIANGLRHGLKVSPEALVLLVISETEDKNQTFVDVIDQGEGISAENLTHVFEPFFTTEAQGTGLGLYLSREICEANQAQLEFLDASSDHSLQQYLPEKYTCGACFRITFAHHKRIL